ncbi:MAG: anti-sigma factor [Pseudaminobacter sp.]|nr:anti-sigma factor [Pseudaminobacter sp.]
MTAADEHAPEPESDDIVAAEYVLGVLPADGRQAAARRIETDSVFARLVDSWEVQLSPMAAAYPEVEAPASVKAALDRTLFSGPAQTAKAKAGLWASLAFWRGMSAAAITALVLAITVPFLSPPAQAPHTRLVASLAAEGSDVRYLAVYDAAHSEVGLSHVSGERASGRDFELWMIEGENPPVSMGVIPSGSTINLRISPEAREKLASGAVLAISLEPAGGSPTGQPTGPVVAAGDLKSI